MIHFELLYVILAFADFSIGSVYGSNAWIKEVQKMLFFLKKIWAIDRNVYFFLKKTTRLLDTHIERNEQKKLILFGSCVNIHIDDLLLQLLPLLSEKYIEATSFALKRLKGE